MSEDMGIEIPASRRMHGDLPPALRQRFRHLHLSPRQPPRRGGADRRSGAGEGRALPAARPRARPQACQGGGHHLHADHITGLGALRDRTQCITVMGEQGKADVVSMRVAEGDRVEVEGVPLDVLYTPGHTDDSYSFLLPDRVFNGDTLLIRGTGRTDFQNGDPRAQYDSIFNKLLKLPDAT